MNERMNKSGWPPSYETTVIFSPLFLTLSYFSLFVFWAFLSSHGCQNTHTLKHKSKYTNAPSSRHTYPPTHQQEIRRKDQKHVVDSMFWENKPYRTQQRIAGTQIVPEISTSPWASGHWLICRNSRAWCPPHEVTRSSVFRPRNGVMLCIQSNTLYRRTCSEEITLKGHPFFPHQEKIKHNHSVVMKPI